jgi:hypothetical protein
MKRISDSRETAMPTPVILKPIEVQLALGTIPVKVRNVAVAVRVLPHRTNVQSIIYDTIP